MENYNEVLEIIKNMYPHQNYGRIKCAFLYFFSGTLEDYAIDGFYENCVTFRYTNKNSVDLIENALKLIKERDLPCIIDFYIANNWLCGYPNKKSLILYYENNCAKIVSVPILTNDSIDVTEVYKYVPSIESKVEMNILMNMV